LVGSTVLVEPLGINISLPAKWFGAKDTVAVRPTCGHGLHGTTERRFAIRRVDLDSVLRATGECIVSTRGLASDVVLCGIEVVAVDY
jgi:hypothetical protein